MRKKKKAPHIGKLNEHSLHADIKAALSLPGDECEVNVGRYVVDIVRDGLLIEIQTGNFSSVKRKVNELIKHHRLRIVHPIALEKWIVKVKPGKKEREGRRKSPKQGRLIDMFRELVYIPAVITHDNVELELLLIREEEIRCEDGKGSWRRKRVSIIDKRLVEIVASYLFKKSGDFRQFIPDDIPVPFTNRSLSSYMGYSVHDAGRITYCLKKMGVIREAGKEKNTLLFEPVI